MDSYDFLTEESHVDYLQYVPARFTILKKLGHGMSGHVYKVLNNEDRTICALKIAPTLICAHEASIMERLSQIEENTYTPRFISVDDFGDYAALAMTYMDGSIIGDLQFLTYDLFIDIVSQILSIVDLFSRIGFHHNDIHHENVMLTDSGRIVVIDFEKSYFEVDTAVPAEDVWLSFLNLFYTIFKLMGQVRVIPTTRVTNDMKVLDELLQQEPRDEGYVHDTDGFMLRLRQIFS